MTGKAGNAIRGVIEQQLAGMPQPRWGVVKDADPATHTVRVTVEPDHTASMQETGSAVVTSWLPVLAPTVGDGWGVVALPQPGQQVLWIGGYGDSDSGVVLGAAYGVGSLPPNVPSGPGGPPTQAGPGEVLLVSSGGAVIRLAGNTAYLQASVTIEGDLAVTGNVTAAGAIVAGQGGADQVGLQTHMHPTAGQGAPSAPTAGS